MQATERAQVKPVLTEEQLVAICRRLVERIDFDNNFSELILLAQGIAGQPHHLACQDAADAVCEYLFTQTSACEKAKHGFVAQLLHNEVSGSELEDDGDDGD